MRLAFVVFLVMLFAACKKNDVKRKDNLIQNPSFKNKLKHWTDLSDGELSGFSHDTPKGGGMRSLEMRPGTTQGPGPMYGSVETYITGESGTNTYELKGWMKSFGFPGTIYMQVFSQNLDTAFFISERAKDWTLYTITETLTLEPNDQIVVGLSSGAIAISQEDEKVLFDLITLEKI